MNILAVGWSVPSLLNCAGTLRRFKRDGHQVSIVVVEGSDNSLSGSGYFDGIIEHTGDYPMIPDADISSDGRTHGQIRAVFAMSDLPEPEFVGNFDYSSVTQRNADILADYRRRKEPDLVIMPFWKSEDARDAVLAKSLLIACRGVGSIIMYRTNDGLKYREFSPNISFDNLLEPDQATSDPTGARSTLRNEIVSQSVEDFESHRILLLEDVENDWL